MSARDRREVRRLIQLHQEKQAQVQTSEVQVIQLSETIVLSAPTLNPMYVPQPRMYRGEVPTQQEQDVLQELIRCAIGRDE